MILFCAIAFQELFDLELQLLDFYDGLHCAAALFRADTYCGTEGAEIPSLMFAPTTTRASTDMAFHS